MNFLSPERLLLLPLVAALFVVYLVVQGRRRSYAIKFTNIAMLDRIAPRKPGWKRHVPALFFIMAMAVLVVGFAQPTHEERVPRERATIILAIDTSLSMEADDVAPTRIEAAKAAASQFIDILPPKINVGVIQFNGNAVMKVAPTTDHDLLKRGIQNLQLGERTAKGEAIFAAIDAIKAIPPDAQGTQPPARIVLMSDGKTTDGRSDEVAAQAAVDNGIPVSTISFGTDNGTIEVPNEPGVQVPVPVDREALQKIAETTKGKFFNAESQGELKDVYQDIGTSVGYTTEEKDASALFIGGALALLLVTSGLSLAWFSRLP
jgi:Ca-activated chloride channel family protein